MAKLLSVLMVEDSQEDTELVMLELKRGGYEPSYHRVETLDDMTVALDRQKWDVVLCDYCMPHMTVAEALRAVREKAVDLPFLVVSGNIVDEDAVAAMRAGAHDFVMKDRLARLAPAVERELREAELRRERQHLEERLRLSQKLESLGLLAGGVAHDFNNLLTGIMANASLVRDGLPQDHPDREMLDTVVVASEKAAHLTRQLLAYSGHGRFIIEPIELSDLVREISRLLRSSLPRTVELVLDLAPGLPPVEADAGQMQQLIMNLIINGGEAIGDRGGSVRVSTRTEELDREFLRRTPSADLMQPGSYIVLEVRDDGCGIEDSIKEKIFDPFFTTKFTGRGLGLAAVLGIVRGHGGTIAVHSDPGQGSTFRVFLPARSGYAIEKPRQFSAHAAAGRVGTILVVDDEDVVRQTAEATLARHGYRVLVAGDGRSGVEVFQRTAEQIDLVLLDLTMPILGGEQTLDELRAIRPDICVLLSSGYDESEARSRFYGKDLAGFLQKPYAAARLLDAVSSALTRTIARAAE